MAVSVTGIVEQFFPGLSATEIRLLASAGVLLAATLAAALLVPLIVRWSWRFVDRRLLRGRTEAWVSDVADRVPWTLPARVIVRLLQVGIAVTTAVVLLVVWGRFHLAVFLLRTAGDLTPHLARAILTVALVVAAYVGMDFLQDAVDRLSARADRMTEHQEQVIYRVSQVTLMVGFVFVGLWIWSVDLGNLLVGAGFLGIVVGLAARQTLGSLIAGFVLMLSRPFEIGDWVVVGDQEGIVTDITIVNTRLRNFDGEHVSIPNDRVGNSVVVNRTEEGRLRLRVEVGVDYAVDPGRAETVATEAIASVDRIANQPAPAVIPTRFADSAVVLELRFWIDNPNPPRKWRAIQAVIHEVKEAFEEEGIKIPFPQRELSGRAETGGFRVVESAEGEQRGPRRESEATQEPGPDGN